MHSGLLGSETLRQALSGVGKQVFLDTHHQVQMAVPIHPYFVREKPGRIEAMHEYPTMKVFHTCS